MEPGEYEAVVAKAGRSSVEAIELLQFMRTHKVHQPELVLVHGGELLTKNARKLGNELWTVMEQVFLAACVAGHDEWRDYCIKALAKKWPNSHRVERLKGMHQESLGKYEKAKEIYAKIIADKPEDTLTRKRMIAMYKQRGKTVEAIEAINSYLETFSTDSEVWHELAELYIEAGSLSRAVYCFEELVLSNPRSVYYLLTYAELLYSTGDYEQSRKYFCLACYLDGDNLRALWGLLAVNMALTEKDKQNEKLLQMQGFGNDKLRDAYKGVGEHGQVAHAMLKDVAAAASAAAA
jgi:tetratricopeptide (TPR) repeat protein